MLVLLENVLAVAIMVVLEASFVYRHHATVTRRILNYAAFTSRAWLFLHMDNSLAPKQSLWPYVPSNALISSPVAQRNIPTSHSRRLCIHFCLHCSTFQWYHPKGDWSLSPRHRNVVGNDISLLQRLTKRRLSDSEAGVEQWPFVIPLPRLLLVSHFFCYVNHFMNFLLKLCKYPSYLDITVRWMFRHASI